MLLRSVPWHCPWDRRCDYESEKGSADYGGEESEPGVSQWLKDIGLLDETVGHRVD
ncbi:hypothetical protein BS47DRAFT_1350945 [Hydnum rufescens UP504]|uniref:Uncharacterized protein n=1 Tax=Hydnum rufescens UP504 TaxID=1448309 RepID=A0A9P6AM43_9AGAM|nr:hypothetical protein BS47DRAFT_1350945 [Hydnum rufescens UP504]